VRRGTRGSHTIGAEQFVEAAQNAVVNITVGGA